MRLKQCLCILLCLSLLSCSSEKTSSSNNSDTNSQSYIGPGSEYSITFNNTDNTFELTESDSSMIINGSFTTLDSSFKKLTVTTVSGGGAEGPTPGDQAYGVEIPGVVFLLQPIEENSEIIAMVEKGSCPSTDFSMNWIITDIDREETFTNDCSSAGFGIDSLGTFSYTHATQQGLLPKLFDICGDTVTENHSLGQISCDAGIGTPEHDSESTKMYLTANGGSIVKITDDNQIIVALPVNKLDSASDLNGDYVGLVMVSGDGDGSNVFNVQGTVSDGTMAFDEINPDDGSIITDNNVNGDTSITTINSPADGFSTGTYSLDSGISGKKITCMSNQDIASSGKHFMFCIGQDPFNEENMFNVLLLSK